jgi:hypothetical protein
VQDASSKKFPIKPDEFAVRAKAKQRSDALASIGMMAAIFVLLLVAAWINPHAPVKPLQGIAIMVYLGFCLLLYLRIVNKNAKRLGMICPKCRSMFNIVSTAKTHRCERCGAQIVEEQS